MATETDICNFALQKLGAKAISSLDEDSRNGRACNEVYTMVRDAEYETNRWNFTIVRASLAASPLPPVFGDDDNVYPLPADFIKLVSPDPETNYNDRDWRVEGRNIISFYSAPLNIRYVSRVTNPGLMPPLFVQALSARLAIELCELLTQSNTKKATLAAEYKTSIAEAKKSNGIQNPPTDAALDTWITARS